jgi:hypothetical protein
MRIVVGLHENADASSVSAALRDLGARDVRPPQQSLPGVVVAEFGGEPAEQPDEGALLARVTGLEGVRYAEPDAMRSSMPSPEPPSEPPAMPPD